MLLGEWQAIGKRKIIIESRATGRVLTGKPEEPKSRPSTANFGWLLYGDEYD
jgi:hypothetical protein